VTGIAIWLAAGARAGLTVGVAATIAAGYAGGVFFEAVTTDVTGATSPLDVLQRDRATFRASFLGLGVAMGIGAGLASGFGTNLSTGRPNGPIVGASIGVVNLVAAGLAFGFIQTSWATYTLSRCWLAMKGDLPWPLMSFLSDAHENRGVLRQVGSVYQFRHYELQRRLADHSTTYRRSVNEEARGRFKRALRRLASPELRCSLRRHIERNT
jgi:hypothetical protein